MTSHPAVIAPSEPGDSLAPFEGGGKGSLFDQDNVDLSDLHFSSTPPKFTLIKPDGPWHVSKIFLQILYEIVFPP